MGQRHRRRPAALRRAPILPDHGRPSRSRGAPRVAHPAHRRRGADRGGSPMSAGPSIFQRFFLPGFAFKAVVIGGGYATGRELVEFFFPSGPVGGLLGLLLTM